MFMLELPFCLIDFGSHRRDCGFFMLTFMGSWDGECHTDFMCKDILNVNKYTLFTWSMSGKFDIDFVKLFGFHPGILRLLFGSCMYCPFSALLLTVCMNCFR
jgi:hypothetical protein